jgi:hypothetical protein
MRFVRSSSLLLPVIIVGAAALAACTEEAPANAIAAESALAAPDAHAPMPPIASGVSPTIVSTLASAGMTLDALPDLTALKAEPGHLRLRAVMKSFTIALGTNCSGCHVAGAQTGADFAIDTPRKNVARKMWSEFVGRLQTSAGAPIFCDTCHQGRVTFLDRSDSRALRGWMKTNFVEGLEQKDGSGQGCATCHGNPFDGEFLSGWEHPTSP